MSQLRAFRPLAATQNIAVTATAQTQVFSPVPNGTSAVRFCNVGTQTVFVRFGEASQVAAVLDKDTPIAAGQTFIFTMSQGTLSFSVIASAVGSTLYSTVGEGL